MAANQRLAVVILNWNGREMLKQFLPNVLAHTPCEQAAVYVADNGSTDDSLQLLTDEFPSVGRIILDNNYGFAEGYNRAIEQVEAEYVLLLNSDVEVTQGWLAPLLAYLDEHPDVVACQPKIRSWHNRTSFEYAGAAGGFLDAYGYPFCRGRILHEVEEDCGQYDDVCDVFWATGAALMIRRADFVEVGGLDPEFFAHMEEIDLCWRLRSRGLRIVCVPQSVVYHVGGGTLKKENPHKTYLNFRNNLLMLFKNLPQLHYHRTMSIRTGLDYLALLVFLLKGQTANAGAVWRARRDFKKMKQSIGEVRADNLRKSSLHSIPEQLKKSILLQFYVKRIKTFRYLNFKQ